MQLYPHQAQALVQTSEAEHGYSMKKFGRELCRSCQKKGGYYGNLEK